MTESNNGGRELVPDSWRECDDTLLDGPAAADVPAEARPWLADQRYVHGLLRALHSQDAAAREARVAAILGRIDRAAAEPARRWLPVSIAALLLAWVSVWLMLPAALPTADAAVQRAVAELARDVTRRFRIVGEPAPGTRGGKHELTVLTRPGGRFLAEGNVRLGTLRVELRAGSDGQEWWGTAMNGALRHVVPAQERERLQQRFGDALELGYVDVQDLVRRLPDDFALRVVGREQVDGRDVLRLEAARDGADKPLRSVRLLCDEATGMVTRIEADVVRGGTARHVTLEYLGEEPGTVAFVRPW